MPPLRDDDGGCDPPDDDNDNEMGGGGGGGGDGDTTTTAESANLASAGDDDDGGASLDTVQIDVAILAAESVPPETQRILAPGRSDGPLNPLLASPATDVNLRPPPQYYCCRHTACCWACGLSRLEDCGAPVGEREKHSGERGEIDGCECGFGRRWYRATNLCWIAPGVQCSLCFSLRRREGRRRRWCLMRRRPRLPERRPYCVLCHRHEIAEGSPPPLWCVHCVVCCFRAQAVSPAACCSDGCALECCPGHDQIWNGLRRRGEYSSAF